MGRNGEYAAGLHRSNAVTDGILYKWLHRQRGEIEIAVRDIIIHLDPIRIIGVLNGKKGLNMVQFTLEGDQLAALQGVDIPMQI